MEFDELGLSQSGKYTPITKGGKLRVSSLYVWVFGLLLAVALKRKGYKKDEMKKYAQPNEELQRWWA